MNNDNRRNQIERETMNNTQELQRETLKADKEQIEMRRQAAKIVRDSMPQIVKDIIDGKWNR